MSKILIAYYSHSGHTKRIAEILRKKIGCDLLFLQTEPAYPKDYNSVLEVSKNQRKTGTLPKLHIKLRSLNDYDYIFIGTPNWWSSLSLPVYSFISEYDLSNKIIIPFITHGGGGIANTIQDLGLLLPNSTLLKEISIYGDGGQNINEQIDAWLKELSIESLCQKNSLHDRKEV